MWKRKLVKIVHTLSATAYMGGIAAYLFVLMGAPEPTEIGQLLTMRTSIDFLVSWLIVPGMLVVLVSGLVSMMVHTPFMEQGWVLLKAVAGVLVFEATLASIDMPAKRAMEAAQRARDDAPRLGSPRTVHRVSQPPESAAPANVRDRPGAQ